MRSCKMYFMVFLNIFLKNTIFNKTRKWKDQKNVQSINIKIENKNVSIKNGGCAETLNFF